MRSRLSILLTLLAAAPPTAAQAPADRNGWHLSGGVDALRLSHVAVTALEGVEVEFGPTGRPAVHLAVGRSVGDWSLALEAGWAGGHVEAKSDAIAVRDLTADVDRYRLAIAAGRHVAQLGGARLAVELGPTLDLWVVEEESRARAGAEARLVLLVPVGSLALEHRIGLGLSGSPIEPLDLGEVSHERGLRTLMVGVGLRTGL
jgi:hypothetical protein